MPALIAHPHTLRVALTAAPMPSDARKTSYTFNLATLRGEQAVEVDRIATGAPPPVPEPREDGVILAAELT